MKEHLVTLETTPGAVANLIKEIIEDQGPFEFPRQGNFGEEIFIIGYPTVSGDGRFFVLDFDARIEEVDSPYAGDLIRNKIRITISPLGEHRSRIIAQSELDLFEGFLDRLINKLIEIFGITPHHQRDEGKNTEFEQFENQKVEHDQNIDTPGGEKALMRWKNIYEVVTHLREENRSQWEKWDEYQKLTIGDYRDAIINELDIKYSERTIYQIIKAGDAGLLK